VSYSLKFGSYSLPSAFAVMSTPQASQVAVNTVPRADGGRVSTRYIGTGVIGLEGGVARDLGSASDTAIRTSLDTLKSNLQGIQNLYTHTDRYWRNCVLRTFDIMSPAPTMPLRMQRVKLEFVTPDPYQYSTTTTTDGRSISATAQTQATTNGGNAPALPAISVTVGGSGAVTIAFTITNSTTGEVFTLAGAVTGGDVIIVDSLAQTVTIGGVDKTSLFDGVFPTLAVGANTILEAYSAGTITDLSIAHNARYY
jgi:Phage tail protein